MPLGKYTRVNRDENEAVRLLEGTLESTKNITTFFTKNDRTPDIDGAFVLTDSDTTAKKRFVVQIKKVDKIGVSADGRVYYDFDTAFFEYIKKHVDEAPGVYFVVDISAQTIYWLYLSDAMLMGLDFENKQTKRVYLTNSNILTDAAEFLREMHIIAEERNKKFMNKTPKQIAEIQEAVEWLNAKIDALPFVKEELSPNFWRFGVANSKGQAEIQVVSQNNGLRGGTKNEKTNMFALYPQIKGIPDYGVREFSNDENNFMETWDFTGTQTPMGYVKNVLEKFLEKYFSDGAIQPKYLPDMVLHEIAFAFLDKIARLFDAYCVKDKFATYYRDEECLSVVEEFLNKTLFFMRHILAVNACADEEKNLKDILFRKLHNGFSFRGIDILDDVKLYSRIDIFSKDYSTATLDDAILFKILKRDYKLFADTCSELRNRNIIQVKRVWDIGVSNLAERTAKAPSDYSLYDTIRFEAAIVEWLSNAPKLYESFLTKAKVIADYKYTVNVRYNVLQSNRKSAWAGIFDYEKKCKYYADDGSLTIAHDKTITSNVDWETATKEGVISSSYGIFHGEFLFDKKPYYEAIRAFTYQGITKALNLKCDGILLNHQHITLFYHKKISNSL
jgi:hypothetical protein